jgi:hypothetical protein
MSLLPLEFLVHKTLATARSCGLHDRGVIAPGYRADLNIIDFANVGLVPPISCTTSPRAASGSCSVTEATGTPSSMEPESRATAKTPVPGPGPVACFAGSSQDQDEA